MTTLSARAAVALVAAAALSFPPSAVAQQEADVPTVSVAPADAPADGPNQGRWFAQELAPGATARTSAVLGNAARVPQTVTVYARDLRFGPDGTPDVVDTPPQDVGAWVRPDESSTTLQPGQQRTVGFSITVPEDAEPGDHIGVIVVESAPTVGQVTVVKRVATRLYVTVPGEATRDLQIEAVERTTVGGLFPRRIDVQASLRNTGRIRVRPVVTVNGRPASGSELLLSQSVEVYRSGVDVPWYGGRVPVDVLADAGEGLRRERRDSVLVVPWALIATVLVGVLATTLAVLALRARRRGRRSELERLQQEVERLAREVADRS